MWEEREKDYGDYMKRNGPIKRGQKKKGEDERVKEIEAVKKKLRVHISLILL
jgi:hypothetical protein